MDLSTRLLGHGNGEHKLSDFAPREKMYLELQNPHPNDARVVDIEEPHLYFIDGSCENVLSVTSFVHAFFPDFDALEEAKETMSTKTFKQRVHQPRFKYYGCATPQDILERWKLWAHQGTQLHRNIELYFNECPDNPVLDEDNIAPYQYFQDFVHSDKWRWRAYRCEWAIFDAETKIAGKIDCVAVDDSGDTPKYVIFDWKRSGNISDRCKGSFQGVAPTFGFGPCDTLFNCKMVTYSLQLATYAHILAKNYGITISATYLLQLHPECKQANWIPTMDLKRYVPLMMEERVKCLKNWAVKC
jgi:hypothetical protein